MNAVAVISPQPVAAAPKAPAADSEAPPDGGFASALDTAAARARASEGQDKQGEDATDGNSAEEADAGRAPDAALDPALLAQVALRADKTDPRGAVASPAPDAEFAGPTLAGLAAGPLEATADPGDATDPAALATAMAARPGTEPSDRAANRPDAAPALSATRAASTASASRPGDAAAGLNLPLPVIAGATAQTPPAASAATAEARLPARLDQPGFAPALGAQLTLMARQGVTEARLHLNPPEMGPVSVQISVSGQSARIDMVAEQALTRQVLEQSMPTLASALRESGLTLTGGGVFEQPRQPGQPGQGGRGGGAQGRAAAGDDEAAAAVASLAAKAPRGVVDLYA